MQIAEKLSALGTKKKEGHSAELVLERKIYVVAAKLPSVRFEPECAMIL